MALAGVASADTVILEKNFVTETGGDFISGTDGWNVYGYNKTYPTTDANRDTIFDVGINGIVNMANWNMSAIEHAITLNSANLAAGEQYKIVYTTYAKGYETANVFFLSSAAGSVAVGNSYNNTVQGGNDGANKVVHFGYFDAATTKTFPCFQTNTGNNPTSALTCNSNGVNVYSSLTYTIILTQTTISGTVTDGSKTGTFSATLEGGYNFDTLGFSLDGGSGNTGVKDISIIKMAAAPEPTTATLSLLALAGLAARRRRR